MKHLTARMVEWEIVYRVGPLLDVMAWLSTAYLKREAPPTRVYRDYCTFDKHTNPFPNPGLLQYTCLHLFTNSTNYLDLPPNCKLLHIFVKGSYINYVIADGGRGGGFCQMSTVRGLITVYHEPGECILEISSYHQWLYWETSKQDTPWRRL